MRSMSPARSRPSTKIWTVGRRVLPALEGWMRYPNKRGFISISSPKRPAYRFT